MTGLPIVDWQAALAEMEKGLEAASSRLDGYRAVWSQVLDAPAARSTAPFPASSTQEWDRWTATASEFAAAAGRDLDECETAVARWQASFSRYESRLNASLAHTAGV